MNDDTLEYIGRLFCGDLDISKYLYKSGPKLVDFFNQYFEYNDVYASPFPSRWAYTFEKIKEIYLDGKLDTFLNIILDKKYIMFEHNINEVEAIKIKNKIISDINIVLAKDNYKLYIRENKVYLSKEDENLKYIGEGGFATVYLNELTNVVVKKLNDESIADKSLVSRFKREYEITKSLASNEHVIDVFDFDINDCSYTMEYADSDLYQYIENNSFSEKEKLNIINVIVKTIASIHKENIIHRDLSPSNILIVNGVIKISDFGLGKNLDILHSHKTLYTRSFGQFLYCDPCQYMYLKDGDKQSDVYSLGKIINYIFNQDPFQDNHILRTIVLKATTLNRDERYKDAAEMLNEMVKFIKIREKAEYVEEMENLISNNIITEAVEQFIYEMDEEKLCRRIIEDKNFAKGIRSYMSLNKDNAKHIIELVTKCFDDVCHKYEEYDCIVDICLYALELKETEYYLKERICKTLNYIAYNVNRFYAQRKIEKIISNGIDPLLEEILRPTYKVT